MQPNKVSPHPLKAVLLVDDNRDLAQVLQRALAEDNYLVDVAHDGQEALLKIKINEYDAVVTDLMMPNLRGDQLYDEIAALRPALAEKFVLITAYPNDPSTVKFLSRATAKCLTKPFPVEQLIGSLRSLLAK
jgi:DNA-binding response OmpR family regulator